ncbi:hypothetical protein PLICRDRAFT_354413 [Plicaturopsis crispa FD-325 SS-3]|uniref:Uncharacterized protein n=1 Tax=Plicaturopsis crispa FD-325 SS-3 TaxID=944288 RepID=A0A0C9SKZ7_PLICR|nr:hypothetical protein PLICRDRAFT_354413 [Plicaturopsis crispa FD-325 SS-3]
MYITSMRFWHCPTRLRTTVFKSASASYRLPNEFPVDCHWTRGDISEPVCRFRSETAIGSCDGRLLSRTRGYQTNTLFTQHSMFRSPRIRLA